MTLAEPLVRQSKRERITKLFTENIGKKYDTYNLHGMFGPSFRARVSEINHDPTSPIRILSDTVSTDRQEASVYWGEVQGETASLFGDLRREHRDNG